MFKAPRPGSRGPARWVNMAQLPQPAAPAKPLVLPRPRPDVAPEAIRPAFAVRYRLLLRLIRAGLTLTVLGLMAFAWINYTYFTVPGERDSQPVLFDISRGDALILARYRPWREPMVGDIVFYRAPQAAADDAFLIGRIEGVPGETVRRRGPTMTVGGREPLAVGFELSPDAPVKDGDIIAEGCYLVLVDSDAVAYTDSRTHGYIGRDQIEYRLALNLAHYWSK